MAILYRGGISGEMFEQRAEWLEESEQGILLYGGGGGGKMVGKMILSVKRPCGRDELVTFKAS